MNNKKVTIVCWGTYDTGKPRVRILLNSLYHSPFNIIECHSNIWNKIEDKSQIKGIFPKIKILYKFLATYPKLLFKYLRLPHHDFLLFPYLGIFDLLTLSPFILIKRTPVILDFFVPLYDSIVNDRKLLSKNNPISYLIFFLEKIALKISKVILVDTNSHGRYLSHLYNIPEEKLKRVFVGAERLFFNSAKITNSPFNTNKFNIFFYGQFIPLQGVEKIINAAKIIQEKQYNDILFTIAGTGQTSQTIDNLIKEKKLSNIKRISWIPYRKLPLWIQNSNICLGIFGESQKANSVIPNKVFQVLASNKFVITADSPAINELFEYSNSPLINTVKENSSNGLADKIEEFYNNSDLISNVEKNKIDFIKDVPQKQLIDIIHSLL